MKGEFEFINDLKERYSLRSVGDDCALLPYCDEVDLLVTTDMLVEEIDFRLEWTTPELLGHKALAVSLSDVAAMGGTPRSALLSLAVPEILWKGPFMDGFYTGWHDLAERTGVELVGGDISRSPDKLVIDSIVVGSVEKYTAVLRSGAKAGDTVFITGFLGGAAAGLELLTRGCRLTDSTPVLERHLLMKQLQPLPQTATSKLLHQYKLPTAMLDISDGLSSDLVHLCEASGVGALIDSELIPVDPAIAGTLGDRNALELGLNGGEDFELLLTVSPDRAPVALDLGFHRIGQITERSGIIEISENGKVSILKPKGFRHF